MELGADPDRTWMIGNSPKSDINPALEAGLGAVLVRNDTPGASKCRPCPSATNATAPSGDSAISRQSSERSAPWSDGATRR